MNRFAVTLVLVAAFAVVGVFMLDVPAHAQTSSAAIAGVVRDGSGGVIAGAQLILKNPATGNARSAVSGESGEFEFSALTPAAALLLQVQSTGFRTTERRVEAVTAGERRIVNVQLAVAGISESVQVVPDVALVSTATPELGGNLIREQIDRVPVNRRDLIALAYLIPGAAPARGFYNLAPRLTINGSSSLSTNYSVDGFDNTDLFLGGPKVPVTIGSTENLKVLVNSYSAEYGRTGNGVFSVTTRSGSNDHRGETFYTWRPGAVLDAPNFFAPRDADGNVIDDNFRGHQAGASAGGPVARNRLFYFADVELARERQDAILTSPLAVGLAPTRYDNQTAFGKLDTRWNDRHTSTFRYQFSDYTHDGDLGFVGGLTLPSAGLQVNYRNQFGAFVHRTVAAAGVNELGLQVGRLRADWRSPDSGPRVIVTDRGATLAVLGSVSDNFFWTERDVQLRDVYTRSAGRHTIRVGADVLWGDFFIDSGPGARGAYVIDLDGRTVNRSGPFITRDELPRDARVLSYSQTFVNPAVNRSQSLIGAFAEDSVIAAPDLTVTLGVRWDYDSVTNTPIADGDWNNIAPRVGVSWAPKGSSRHQIRGGYGIFYERIPFAVYSDTIFNNPDGGAVNVTFAPGTPFAPPAFPSAFPRDALADLQLLQLPPRNVQVFDPNLKSPRTEQISLGHVISLTSDFAVAVDYVHSRGRNLIRRIDVNAPASVAPGPTRSVADADHTRPVAPVAGGFRLIEQDQSSGRSTFDGMYLTARKRYSHGFAFDVAYTLSKIENDTDDINFRPVDSRRPDEEFGPSLNDRRHVLAVNGVVRLPLEIDLAPVLFLSSGQPLNVTTGRDDNGDTVFNDRPAGVPRNSERTPGFAQMDLGVLRQFQAGAATIEARAEIFNLFNRTNVSGFFNWGASGVRPDEQGTIAFQPTQAGPSRQFQFSARVRF